MEFEIDIELRMRKTLVFGGPTNEAAAREIVEMALKPGGLDIWTLQKKVVDNGGAKPIEMIIDNDPQIVEIRRVD